MTRTVTEVSTTELVDTKRGVGRRKRRQWSEAMKRRIVAETLAPDSSVSIVARRHDLNANQVFKWRRELAPEQPPAPVADKSAPLPPVEIVSERSSDPRPRGRRSGTIEITFGCGARMCLRGEVSPETLRQVIELLRQ